MDDAAQLLDGMLGLRRPKGDRWRGALLGDFSGNTDAPLDGWKYVRIPVAGSGNYALGMFPGQAVSGTAYNTPVIIEYDPLNNQRIIVGPDVQAIGSTIGGGTITDPGGYAVSAHAWTHFLGGGDQVDIANEQLTNVQLRPSATNTEGVTVKGGIYTVGGVLVKLTYDVEVDLTAYFPLSGVKYVWITLASTGAAVVVDDSITSLAALTLPITANHLVGFVMLQFSQPIRWQNIKNVQGTLDDVLVWRLYGNDGISAATHWLGSINNADVVFKRYNTEIYRLTATALLSLLPVLAKPTGTAGIQLDPNAATGNFTLSLSPANLTGNQRVTFNNLTGTAALGAGTITGSTTNDVTVAAHTHAFTPPSGLSLSNAMCFAGEVVVFNSEIVWKGY